MQIPNVKETFSKNMWKIEKQDGGERCIKTTMDVVSQESKDKQEIIHGKQRLVVQINGSLYHTKSMLHFYHPCLLNKLGYWINTGWINHARKKVLAKFNNRIV